MLILNLNISGKGIYFQDKDGQKLSLTDSYKKILKRFKSVFQDLEIFILNMISYFPSHFVRKFFLRLAGVKIGKESYVHVGAKFFGYKNVTIGKGTIIGNGIFIDGRDRVTIGDHTDIASEVMIYNSEHDLNDPTFKANEEPVSIGNFCFIGPRAIIMPGVTIADGAVVAGGAVVTKSVEKNTIVGGVPAKVIGVRMLRQYSYKLGRPKLFQ